MSFDGRADLAPCPAPLLLASASLTRLQRAGLHSQVGRRASDPTGHSLEPGMMYPDPGYVRYSCKCCKPLYIPLDAVYRSGTQACEGCISTRIELHANFCRGGHGWSEDDGACA